MYTHRNLAVTQTVFDSLQDMLAPNALSELLGAQVNGVDRLPFVVAHRSANELYQILIETAAGRTRLILKEFQPQRDWVMRLTHDTNTREAMLYVHGVYSQMPPEILVPVIATARHGDSWANLMWDVSADLLPLNTMQSGRGARSLIHHLAALHARFWSSPVLQIRELGLSSLEDFVTVLAPARVQAEIDAGRAHPVMEMAVRGWQSFEASAPADVVETIQRLQSNPTRLLRELETLPKTLLHGDYKLANLGLDRRDRAVVLDWQDAACGFGALDLGYFLALNARWLPYDLPTLVEMYRGALKLRGHSMSPNAVDLGLVAGGAQRLLWLMVLNDQDDLEWWYDLIRRVSNLDL